jgi:hypothetical protein
MGPIYGERTDGHGQVNERFPSVILQDFNESEREAVWD